MTRAQKRELGKFLHKQQVTPRYEDIRTDVARALYSDGYVTTTFAGDGFRAGYAPLSITNKGREAAVAPLPNRGKTKP